MTERQTINNNAKNSNSVLNYKKKIILNSIKELNKLELEIAELEATK